MSKRKAAAPARNRRVAIPLSSEEFQLIDYAASRSNIRGTYAWMRAKLLDAAREKLSDAVVADILAGRATTILMRESLAQARRATAAPANPAMRLVDKARPAAPAPASPAARRRPKVRR